MDLKELINIKRHDVIAIVGSGGKTSLMYKLAKECSKKKVLVTTSVKIKRPFNNEVNYEFYLNDNDYIQTNNGITLVGDYINSENKVICSCASIKKVIPKFDYTLIEADGSKEKPLKGWNDMEPVYIEEVRKTIGVIPINIIGKEINNNNIHRINNFIDLLEDKNLKNITINHLVNIISNKNGLFKNSIGEKILFLNCIDNKRLENVAQELLQVLLKDYESSKIKIIGGSLKNSNFFELKV